MVNSSAEIENIEKIGPGIHAVLFYRRQSEVIQAVRSYLKISLENNEKCIYIDQQQNQKKVLNDLREMMTGFDKYLENEQLLVLSREEIYGDPSQFKAVDIIKLIKNFSSQAEKDGFKGLAITGELNGIMNFNGGKKEIIEYEWKLNEEIFTDYPVSALCRYNINKFDNEVIKAAVELHDYIIWEGSLNDNPYFIDPAGYKNNSVAEYEIKSWLNNIDQYQKKESNYQKELELKEEEISASNQQLQAYNQEIMAMNEELVASVNELENLNKRFKKIITLVSDIDNLNTVSEKDFLSHLLNEAVDIVPEADFGSIYTFGEQYVNFVAAIGYDLAELKGLKINKKAFFNQKETIEVIDHQQLKNRDQENMEQSDFQKLKNTSLNKLKETMYLDLELNGEKRAGISLDISAESSQVFSSNSKKYLQLFIISQLLFIS